MSVIVQLLIEVWCTSSISELFVREKRSENGSFGTLSQFI